MTPFTHSRASYHSCIGDVGSRLLPENILEICKGEARHLHFSMR